jgi:hypothetical protein
MCLKWNNREKVRKLFYSRIRQKKDEIAERERERERKFVSVGILYGCSNRKT